MLGKGINQKVGRMAVNFWELFQETRNEVGFGGQSVFCNNTKEGETKGDKDAPGMTVEGSYFQSAVLGRTNKSGERNASYYLRKATWEENEMWADGSQG